jgi:putative solute:sodium symporter small subunit
VTSSRVSDPGRRGPSPARRASALDRYWRANLRWMLSLLALWALVGPGLSILFVEPLNKVRLGGFPLGFWFAQQGSILVFVLLIAIYALVMNRLDARHRGDLEAEERG